jgi:hypothetical protein
MMFHIVYVGVFIVYFHIKFHIYISNGPLVTAIYRKLNKDLACLSHYFTFHKIR